MAEDFILLLESEKEKVREVLRPHVKPELLKHLVGGFFDEERKRFIAYALMRVTKSYANKYGYLFDNFTKGGSAELSTSTSEKRRKYRDENKTSFSYKSTTECIEEGLYRNNLISFIGEYDFDEWNVLQSCCFTDEKDQTTIIKNKAARITGSIKEYVFSNPIFDEVGKNYEELMKLVKPDATVAIPTSMKAFTGHSDLVYIVRIEKNTTTNLAYEAYVKTAIFEPLAITLKTVYPDVYDRIEPFWLDRCDMMYPNHKQFCLLIVFAFDIRKKARLQYFIYVLSENKVYEWTYLPSKPYPNYGWYSEKILEDFKAISTCDSIDYIRNPECTLDDDDFWNNYVFKKETGRYTYLKELVF